MHPKAQSASLETLPPPRSGECSASCDCHAASTSDQTAQLLRWGQLLRLPGRALVGLLLLLITFYQRFISRALAPRCRFSPSCSAYAVQTLRKDGLFKGVAKATWRVLRCNPFGRGGYDPP